MRRRPGRGSNAWEAGRLRVRHPRGCRENPGNLPGERLVSVARVGEHGAAPDDTVMPPPLWEARPAGIGAGRGEAGPAVTGSFAGMPPVAFATTPVRHRPLRSRPAAAPVPVTTSAREPGRYASPRARSERGTLGGRRPLEDVRGEAERGAARDLGWRRARRRWLGGWHVGRGGTPAPPPPA